MKRAHREGPMMKPRAAECPAFDDRHFETFFCCEKRSFAASRSGPYDRNLVFFVHNPRGFYLPLEAQAILFVSGLPNIWGQGQGRSSCKRQTSAAIDRFSYNASTLLIRVYGRALADVNSKMVPESDVWRSTLLLGSYDAEGAPAESQTPLGGAGGLVSRLQKWVNLLKYPISALDV
jgi:hypothetical protein